MIYKIPTTCGVSALQRKSKAILDKVKSGSEPVFLTEHNQISAVILSSDNYEQLINSLKFDETRFWSQATESSLKFWDHKSNNAYEKMF